MDGTGHHSLLGRILTYGAVLTVSSAAGWIPPSGASRHLPRLREACVWALQKKFNEVSLEYDRRLIGTAKALRRNLTPQERKLWYQILNKYRVRFQRQKVVGHHIADFYCASAKLIIEIDGSGLYTDEQQRSEEIRTDTLQQYGLMVIRFSNMDVTNNFEGVCYEVDKVVQERLKALSNSRHSSKAPSDEGAPSNSRVGE